MTRYATIQQAKLMGIDTRHALRCRTRYLSECLEDAIHFAGTGNELERGIAVEHISTILERLFKLIPPPKFEGEAITEEMIERAKARPINEFLEFTHNKACCVAHDEDTPSMHYYAKKNRVHCFGCGYSGDAISVYMKIYRCTFQEAVRGLI